MKRVLTSAAVLASLLAAGPAPLRAQVIVGGLVHFGITGGATVPTGDQRDVSETGWHAGALVDFGLPLFPLGFRVDGTWQQLGGKDVSVGVGRAELKTRIIAGTINASYGFGAALPTKFYVIGGLGVYNLRNEVDVSVGGVGLRAGSDSETKFGLNVGAGLRFYLSGLSTFAEARWHSIFDAGPADSSGDRKSAQVIPISVGVTF